MSHNLRNNGVPVVMDILDDSNRNSLAIWSVWEREQCDINKALVSSGEMCLGLAHQCKDSNNGETRQGPGHPYKDRSTNIMFNIRRSSGSNSNPVDKEAQTT
jgi:hypothetical protein